ncbi:GGDEF domain-containing protein [Aquabacterium sp.]|uniref:GGDEF domain-containing protein n=1 Tax=Aquabacterium sp. TaxID=1872578 RepID=UPI0025B9A2FA|nr:GGDEF domain-containing protein [Aquabacterium sp.]
MWHVDPFSCYAVAGAGSLVGLGLMSLVRTDQPRVRQALTLYRWAFACMSGLFLMHFGPEPWQPDLLKVAIGLSGMGVALLAWAFRQLNGRRTPPRLGLVLTLLVGLVLFAAAWSTPERYVQAIGFVFALTSVALAGEQGWFILRGPQITRSEASLLLAASGSAFIWVSMSWHVLTVPGPYAPYWLHLPDWLLPWCCLMLALLPLSVASVVFAIINERLNQQLRARALSDDLTGALSRRGLRELGERMLAQQQRQPRDIAVLMVDADHFKAINDRHGHLVGDDVLRHLTQTLRDNLRVDALLARYGGEEFTVLLPVRQRDEALKVAERLRDTVARSPCESRSGPIPITVSIGVSYHGPGSTLEDDLSRADALLYRAKAEGRNRVVAEAA